MLTQEQQNRIVTYYYEVSATSRGISYYEIELELVDHMTEWIEDKMTELGVLFEEAFEMMKTVFPREECQVIVRSKAKSISQQMMRNSLKAFLTYFSWPKIAVTFLLITIIIIIDRNCDISRFPSAAIHLLNLANLSTGFFRNNIVYHNYQEKVLNLISLKKATQFQFYFAVPAIAYLILSMCSITDITVAKIIYTTALYMFPLFFLLSLAGRATHIAINKKIREDYPEAFT